MLNSTVFFIGMPVAEPADGSILTLRVPKRRESGVYTPFLYIALLAQNRRKGRSPVYTAPVGPPVGSRINSPSKNTLGSDRYGSDPPSMPGSVDTGTA